MRNELFRICVLVPFLWVVTANSFASERQPNKTIAIGAVGGFPQFLGLELSYVGWPFITPGISIGSAPINTVINTYLKLNPITLSLSTPDTYKLYPVATYVLYSGSTFLKYYIPKTGLSFGLLFSTLTFNASIQGNLKNETSGATVYSAVTGSASMTQIMAGPTVGYMITIGPSFFMELTLGGAYLIPPIYSMSLSGTGANAIGIIPGADAAFDSAKGLVQTAFDNAIASYRSQVKFLPSCFLSVGISF